MTQLTAGHTKAIFFDLDGTLVDTAPDMVAALQDLQRAHDIEPLDYDVGRAHVSKGAVGLLTLAFPMQTITPDGPLMCDFISRYSASVCDRSIVFSGLHELLDQLDRAACPWGVVTNKPAHLTDPILEQLALANRVACAISGDTLPKRKPDPAPLLHACELAGVRPEESIYIGDAARDIEAGQRAAMPTIAVAYGYITAGDDPYSWGADQVAKDTAELAKIVLKAVNLNA